MCPVEQRGIEILFRRRSFAAGNHPEAAEIAQMDRFSVGQRFIHDGQESIKYQQDITAAGSAVFADTAANTVQVDLLGDAGYELPPSMHGERHFRDNGQRTL